MMSVQACSPICMYYTDIKDTVNFVNKLFGSNFHCQVQPDVLCAASNLRIGQPLSFSMRIMGYRAGNTEKNAELYQAYITGPKYIFNEDTFRTGTPKFVELNTHSVSFPGLQVYRTLSQVVLTSNL